MSVRPRPSLLAAALLLAAFVPLQAQTTLVVSPVAGSPTASGTALLSALAGIADNSSSKPYLIKVEPGIYDLQLVRLVMKPYVDIEGSGQFATVIKGGGNVDLNLNDGVVWGANSAELRDLQVKVVGTAARPYAIALYNQLTAPRLRNIVVFASGGTANWGIRNAGGSPLIEECTISVVGGTLSYGVSNSSGSSARPTLRRTLVSSTSATTSYGIYNDLQSLASELRDVQITAAGLTSSYGFYAAVAVGAGVTTRITGSTITAQSGSNTNIGIYWNGGGGVDLFVEQSQVRGSGGTTSRGIDLVNGALTVDHSELSGATHSLRALVVDPVRVGASRLAGPRSLGVSAKCAASYDGTFSAFVCP